MEDIPLGLSSLPPFDNVPSLADQSQAMAGLDISKKIKRPPNAFLLFCVDNRLKIKDQNPDMSNVQVTQILADQWKNLDENAKSEYKRKFNEEQKAFKEECPDYKYKRTKMKRPDRPNEERFNFSVPDVKTLLSMPDDELKQYILLIQSRSMQLSSIPEHQVQDFSNHETFSIEGMAH